MARTPQSFEKRQRERRKQMKREEKLERRLIRSEEKKLASQNPEDRDANTPDSKRGDNGEGEGEEPSTKPIE